MTEEMNPQGTPPQPVPAPTPQPIPAPTPQQAAPQPPIPPTYAPVSVPAPAPAPMLTQLSGGMKFAWLVIGCFMGIPGMILSWLVNVDKHPQVKSDAIKFSIIGFVINIVMVTIFTFFISALLTAAMVEALAPLTATNGYYSYY